jgi:hypothetical protein
MKGVEAGKNVRRTTNERMKGVEAGKGGSTFWVKHKEVWNIIFLILLVHGTIYPHQVYHYCCSFIFVIGELIFSQ